MKIGILIAMQKEFSLIKELLQEEQTLDTNAYKYIIGKIGKHEIILQQCGVGKVNAAVGTENLINAFSPDLVISSGVAGGASEDVEPLDIVVCENTCYHDVYCGEDNHFGQIQGMPPQYHTPKTILSIAKTLHYKQKIHIGQILTGDWFVTTKEKMQTILSAFPNPKAIDMETCAIAQTCYIRKTPFMSFRIISDNPLKPNHSQQYKDFWTIMANQSFDVVKQFIEMLPQDKESLS